MQGGGGCSELRQEVAVRFARLEGQVGRRKMVSRGRLFLTFEKVRLILLKKCQKEATEGNVGNIGCILMEIVELNNRTLPGKHERSKEC